MPIVPVSLDDDVPKMRTVIPRTAQIRTGALCEVWADERMQLCLVESVGKDGAIVVRRLPDPPWESKAR